MLKVADLPRAPYPFLRSSSNISPDQQLHASKQEGQGDEVRPLARTLFFSFPVLSTLTSSSLPLPFPHLARPDRSGQHSSADHSPG